MHLLAGARSVAASGRRLQIVMRRPPARRLLVAVDTQSLQIQEPLPSRPLQAEGYAPWGACLIWPSGRLDRHGLCGFEPGP